MKTKMLVILIAVLLISLASLSYTAAVSSHNANSSVTPNESQGDTQQNTQYHGSHANGENSRPEAALLIKSEQ